MSAPTGRRIRNLKVGPTKVGAQVLVGLDPENYDIATWIDVELPRFPKGEAGDLQKAMQPLEDYLGKVADAAVGRAMRNT